MDDWVGAATGITGSIVAIGGLVYTLLKNRTDRSLGLASAESTNRRDTVSDRDSLIDQLQEEDKRLATRNAVLEREYFIERDWNRLLIDHIFRGKPPPPPKRPEQPTLPI